MANNPQQPGEYDAVLGRQNQAPESAAVLGGIQGVKLRLSNPNPKVRIAVLPQVLNYGETGLDLVIQALNDQSLEVQNAAYALLKSRTEAKVKEALRIFDAAPLSSAVGMDYNHLRDLLAAGKWKEADEETWRVMIGVAKQELQGHFAEGNIENFPPEDLRTIDQLWIKYSHGRFGFSVQTRIYQSLGGTKEDKQIIWEAFEEKVGWRKGGRWLSYRDITFDIKAPVAHLPVVAMGEIIGYEDKFFFELGLVVRKVILLQSEKSTV